MLSACLCSVSETRQHGHRLAACSTLTSYRERASLHWIPRPPPLPCLPCSFFPGAVSLMDRCLIPAWQVPGNASTAAHQSVEFAPRRAAEAELCHLQLCSLSLSLSHWVNVVPPCSLMSSTVAAELTEPGRRGREPVQVPPMEVGFPSAGVIHYVPGTCWACFLTIKIMS